jgi:uncharacterized glyoxalase superfamily protein PhnB
MNGVKLESLIPNIMVDDVNKTIEYYEKFLEFKKIISVPENGQLDWAMIGRDSVNLMLQKRKSIVDEYPKFNGQPVGAALVFYVSVKNIDELYKRLDGQVTIYIKPHKTFYGRKEFAIEDCNGYVITFAEDSQ